MIDYATILANFGIHELNQMQTATMQAIPLPTDVVVVSPTGTGKTLGFLLPSLQLLKPEIDGVQLIIIVPSRELAIQIEQVFKKMGTDYKINCCYGGHSVRIEENNFTNPPAVLVGTPGRIAHHISSKKLITSNVKTLILDEFDKCLEFGFKTEMEFIISECKTLNKRILTSATALVEIPRFVRLNTNAVTLDFTPKTEDVLPSTLVVKQVRVEGDDKLETLMLLITKIGAKSTIVFCNHREAVNRISEQLSIFKVAHGYYHGGLEQIDREKTLIKLRNGSINLLVTTDLAARGLDIPEIEAIVHYQLPPTEDVMIHRNGRTARMNATGTAYFMLDVDDYLPKFLTITPKQESLPSKFIAPTPAPWKTLYISAGKKDKVNKMDIVGMLIQKGNLQKDEIGKIEVLDKSAYVAIASAKINKTLHVIANEKIKNKKVKMEISS
jgi:superfamily II DNA/RNA helicase